MKEKHVIGMYGWLKRPPLFRFWQKIVVLDNGCWQWVSAKNPGGYGQFWVDSGRTSAYIFSYRIFKGEIPEGLELDHLCRNHSCVNPFHLDAVTHKENTLRGNTIASMKSQQTHCLQGHPFTPENTYVRKNGTRRCRICMKQYQADRNAIAPSTEVKR